MRTQIRIIIGILAVITAAGYLATGDWILIIIAAIATFSAITLGSDAEE